MGTNRKRTGRARSIEAPQKSRPDVASNDRVGDSDVVEIRAALGHRIRELRKQNGLTMREFAESVGVTGSSISQMESGTVLPSVATMVKMAAVLHVQVGVLFDQPDVTSQVVRREDRPAFDYPEKGVRDEMLSSDPTRRLEVLVTKLEPEGGTGSELFTHGAEVELCHVLRGRVELTLGEERIALGPGDSATFSGDTPHGINNPHQRPAEVLWVVTPATY